MKALVNSFLRPIGIEVRHINAGNPFRPIGILDCFLEDIKARGFSPRGIVDIGANRGDWTRQARLVFPDTPTLMIEPQAEMEIHLFKTTMELPDCHYVKAGVGREEGELVQTIWEDLAGSSFLPGADAEQLAAGTQRKTKITTINTLLLDHYAALRPDLVKLDIQGFELEALSGASTLFGKTEVFILETSLFRFLPKMPITREVIAFMADRNYELYDITEYIRRPHDGALGQVDLAFVKSEGMFRKDSKW